MGYKVFSVRMSEDTIDKIHQYNELRKACGVSKVQIGEYISESVDRCLSVDAKILQEEQKKKIDKIIKNLS